MENSEFTDYIDTLEEVVNENENADLLGQSAELFEDVAAPVALFRWTPCQ